MPTEHYESTLAALKARLDPLHEDALTSLATSLNVSIDAFSERFNDLADDDGAPAALQQLEALLQPWVATAEFPWEMRKGLGSGFAWVSGSARMSVALWGNPLVSGSDWW